MWIINYCWTRCSHFCDVASYYGNRKSLQKHPIVLLYLLMSEKWTRWPQLVWASKFRTFSSNHRVETMCFRLAFLRNSEGESLPSVLPSLTSIINASFATRIFPCSWKVAEVSPILKDGDFEEPLTITDSSLSCSLCQRYARELL